jgi:hypothetical protein
MRLLTLLACVALCAARGAPGPVRAAALRRPR